MDGNWVLMWLKGVMETSGPTAGPELWGRVRNMVDSAQLVNPAPVKIVEVYRPPTLDKSRIDQELNP